MDYGTMALEEEMSAKHRVEFAASIKRTPSRELKEEIFGG
jgi:hypothetical protein